MTKVCRPCVCGCMAGCVFVVVAVESGLVLILCFGADKLVKLLVPPFLSSPECGSRVVFRLKIKCSRAIFFFHFLRTKLKISTSWPKKCFD